MSDEQISKNLREILADWAGIDINTIFSDSVLSDLWDANPDPNRSAFFPTAVDDLIERIQNHPFFKECPEADALEKEDFTPAIGPLQTFRNLFERLQNC